MAVADAMSDGYHDPFGLGDMDAGDFEEYVDEGALYRPPEPPEDPADDPETALQAHYDDRMDDLKAAADDRGVDLSVVALAYTAILGGDSHLTSHEEVMVATRRSFHEARQAAGALSDVDDIHECYDDDWDLWWVRCDSFIKDKCEDRRISLYRYFDMKDILSAFQQETIGWYVRRNRRQQQPFRLTDKKEEYVRKIQNKHFPDKPVGEEWSRHIAARYVRTAQDSVIRSYDLTY